MHTIGNDKKILLVTRPLCPPCDQSSKNFAYTLARTATRYALTILTCRSGTPPSLPSRVSQFPLYTSSSLALSLWQKIRLALFLNRKKHAFAIIHSFFTPTTQNTRMMRLCLAGSGAALIQTVATLREDLYTDAEIKKILFGDMIVTYSAHAKKKLNALGFTNVRHIYPGIDLSLFTPAQKNINLMKSYGIAKDDFVLLYPGEYTRLDATDIIIEALLRCAEKEKNVKLIMACRVKNSADARKKEQIRLLLDRKSMLHRVIFTDTVADMNALYNLADTILFPVGSMRGKFDIPLSVIEAYACEKPVILSDLPILREFSDPSFSVIIPRKNASALAEAILHLTRDDAAREMLGTNARAFVEKNFSITTSTESYEKLYDEL